MAPRKQTKAAGSVVADANGDASPLRKRKIASATKPVVEELKQPRTGLRRGKEEKVEVNDNDAVAIDASPPKKARSGKGKTTATETKGGKSNKSTKAEEAMNNAEEKAPKQTTEKKARATKTAGAMAKKAGTKEQPAAKSKAKESAKKTKNNTAATENGADGDAAEVANVAASMKRTRGKVVEKENAMPATRTAKASKKRKNAEKAAGDAEVAEEKLTVPDKMPRGKPKKTAGVQAANEPEVKSKGKAKKNTVKAEAATSSSKEDKEGGQNAQDTAEQDNTKVENTRNTRKRNAKKADPKAKRNAAVMERDDDTPVEDAVETDIQENGKVDNVQSKKKRNVGKTNTMIRDKTEAKGRQKKGHATATAATVTIDKMEISKDAEDDAVGKVNTASLEAQDENYMNEVTQSDEFPYKKEVKGEVDKVELPESVESAHSINNEILENEANTSIDKDEN